MTQEKLKNLISQGENEFVEFKLNFDNSAIETLVAFANHKGGKIFIGVSDKGQILGTKLGKESIQKMINEIKQKTDYKLIPTVETFEYNHKIIIMFFVIEYPSKPISFKGKYYKRVKNSNHLMNADEIANEYLRTRNKSWDMFLTDENYQIKDLDFNKIIKTINKINKRRELKIENDPLNFLRKFALIQDDKITNAAFLLFGKNQTHVSEIQIGLFEKNTVIKKSLTIREDLLTEVDIVMDFIMSHITKEYIITGKPERDEKWQYPMSAIREFIVNAIIHRDYRIGVHSQFRIFRNKIVLWNIGKLPNDLNIEDLYNGNERSIPRNIRIAEIFKEVGLIEKYGSGILKSS